MGQTLRTPVAAESSFGLAIETSGALGGVAVGRGAEVLASRTFPAVRRHATDLLPTMDALCREFQVLPSSLSVVFLSIGPGSFTGLRIGLTAARMLAFASGTRVVAVPSLDVVAQNALDADPVPKRVCVMIDAKRNCVYAATYVLKDGLFQAERQAEEVEPARYLAEVGADCSVMGEGVAQHHNAIVASGLRILPEMIHRPRPESLYRLGAMRAAKGEFDEPRMLIPIYIRPPEAEEKRLRLMSD